MNNKEEARVAEVIFEKLLQNLPDNIQQKAVEFKAFCRSRKVKTPLELLHIVFMYCGLDFSMRNTAANFTLLYGESITDTAIEERLKTCGPWVKAMLAEMLHLNEHQLTGRRVFVIDATTIEAPGAKGTDHRLHGLFDLLNLEFVQMNITDAHVAESLRHFSFQDGDIIIADGIYCRPNEITELKGKGVDLILRYNTRIPLYDENGEKIDLVKEIKKFPKATMRTIEGFVKTSDGKTQKIWLHIYKLSEEEANNARRRLRKKGAKKGYTPKKETLFLAGWFLVISTIPSKIMDSNKVANLYRSRWQIELAFKRMKSILDADKLRAKANGPLAHLWLHGKMLFVLLIDRRIRQIFGGHFLRLDNRQRFLTCWRLWKLCVKEIQSIIIGVSYWKIDADNISKVLKVLAERKRRRKLQRLPNDVIVLIMRKMKNLNLF